MTGLPIEPDVGARTVSLAVGELVVYGGHGIGRISKSDPAAVGHAGEVVVEFAEGLTVTLPGSRAVAQLRPLCTEDELATVQATLRAEPHDDDLFQRRLTAAKDKLARGDAVSLAEIIRDGARRERRIRTRELTSRLSPSERQLYMKARRLLSDEIQAVRGVAAPEADAWIEAQLPPGDGD